jgi:DNA-binding MarR family transcriptional regulator
VSKLTSEELAKLESALTAFIRIVKKPGYWEEFQRFADVTIDRPSAAILHVLYKQDCQFQSLVNQLGLEAPSISRKVHELENRGLIERKPNEDQRVHELRLSPKAKEIVERLIEAKRSIMSQVLANWSKDERQLLVNTLQRLAQDLSEHFENKDT